MHRIIKGAIATAAAACSLSALSQAPAHATGSVGVDSIVASVINNPNGTNNSLAAFNLLAVSGPQGQNATGSFAITSFDNFYGAKITCMAVSGGTATVVGRITWSLFGSRKVGTYTRVFLQDTGPFRDNTDKIQFGAYTGDPNVCPDPTVPMREPITFGIVAISDAP